MIILSTGYVYTSEVSSSVTAYLVGDHADNSQDMVCLYK